MLRSTEYVVGEAPITIGVLYLLKSMDVVSDCFLRYGFSGYDRPVLLEVDDHLLALGFLEPGLRLKPPAVGAYQEEDDGSEHDEHHRDVNDCVDGLVQPHMMHPPKPVPEVVVF